MATDELINALVPAFALLDPDSSNVLEDLGACVT